MNRRLWVIAALFGVSAVLSVCLSACAGAGAPSVPPIDDGAGPTRITVRFDMSMGADAAARGTTPVVNGVQLESDPLSMNWDGSVLSGDVRVNNVSTGSTMTDIEARIFSVNPPDVGIGWNHDTNGTTSPRRRGSAAASSTGRSAARAARTSSSSWRSVGRPSPRRSPG
ncbi:MAG: hypothetical protein ACOX6M_13175 [Armatimonadota bacterium]